MQENFYQGNNVDAIRQRQQEIDALEKRLAELKRQQQMYTQSQQMCPPMNGQPQAIPQQMPSQGMPPQQQYAQQMYVPPQQRQQWNSSGQQMPQKDVEKTIGKTVMGICASVLIFISFIFFAMLVLPYLNDTIKMLMMYGISGGFTLAGALLLMHDKENKAFIALMGCGVGAIYISVFLSTVYFGAMNEIVFYICLFVWAVFVCVFSKLHSGIFLIIGQLGINLSVMAGVSMCNDRNNVNQLLVVAIYNLIAQTVFYFSHFRKGYKENLINQIGWAVGMYVILAGGCEDYAADALAGACVGIVAVLTALVPFVLSMTAHHIDVKQNVTFGVFNSLYLWAAFCVYTDRLDNSVASVVAAIILILFLVVLELRIPQMNHVGKIVLQCSVFLMLDIVVLNIELWNRYAAMAPLALGCLIYGFCRGNAVYKAAGLAYAILLLSNPMSHGMMVIWGILLAMCTVVLWLCFRQQYRPWMKMVGYLLMVCVLTSNLPFVAEGIWNIGEWKLVLVLAVPALLNILVSKVPLLYRDLRTGAEEHDFRIETGVLQIVLMVVSYLLMILLRNRSTTIAAILLGMLVTFANSYSLMKRDENGWMGVYVGAKAVLWVFFAAIALKAPSILISVAGLLAALSCVVTGFVVGVRTGRGAKQIRIFGLVMVLICLLKLIMFDLPYDSTLFHALGFFISGVLCFAISLVYNLADKYFMRKNEKNSCNRENHHVY